MTRICVSLTEETTAGLIDRMAELAGVGRPVRDPRRPACWTSTCSTILRARTRPLLLTCRPASEGGRWPDDDPRRRLMLLEGVKRGFDYVDVELPQRASWT